jgi:sugar phosphate isomerase/epimerase
MRLDIAGGSHLTYCTNIHPGESWPEVLANVKRFVPRIRRRMAPHASRFGVGLRLSARAADDLAKPGAAASLRAYLEREGLYVFTVNGFPYGRFHGARVKELVYRPDWLEDERTTYTVRLAEVLAELLPDGVEGTVSTVPCAFRPRVRGPSDESAMAERMIRAAAALHRIRGERGRVVSLALEPEPFCHLENVAETVCFFERHLFSKDARACFARLAGASRAEAEAALRLHLGVCLDTCHMAVAHEDPTSVLAAFDGAGIRVPKLQVSAGLEIPGGGGAAETESTLAALRPFADDVYLHQVVERAPGGLVRYPDLPDAIRVAEARGAIGGTWRAHFHVPLYREALGPFRTTRAYVAEVLARARTRAMPTHFEVETYTWDVLPEEHRREDVADAVARELSWTREHLLP